MPNRQAQGKTWYSSKLKWSSKLWNSRSSTLIIDRLSSKVREFCCYTCSYKIVETPCHPKPRTRRSWELTSVWRFGWSSASSTIPQTISHKAPDILALTITWRAHLSCLGSKNYEPKRTPLQHNCAKDHKTSTFLEVGLLGWCWCAPCGRKFCL